MGAYKYITATLQKQYKERGADYRAKIISWRKGPAMARVERPSNLSRARTLGYQAKQGYSVVRIRVDKGRRTRRKPMGGRKHKTNYRFVQPQLSHQAIAEQRVNRIYRNMEVLNSYWVGEDGNYKFFEVLLADPSKASVNISSAMRQGKAFRGLTSAGNSRGPSKKKQLNKRLRRKLLARKAYHYEPYVKKPETTILKRPAAQHPKLEHKAPEAHAGHKEPEAHAKHETHARHEPPKPETQHPKPAAHAPQKKE